MSWAHHQSLYPTFDRARSNTVGFCVVQRDMTDEERNTIIAVWGDRTLRIKLEDNPYGLTPDELRSLKINDSLNNLVRLGVRDDASGLPVS
jgi:hypothetical protein